MKKFMVNVLPTLIWMMFIFFLSDQSVLPGAEVDWMDFIFKKCAHMFVYGVLFFLWYRAFSSYKVKYPMFSAACLTIFYSFSDEFHQSFVPGRTATFRDLGYDSLGTFISYLRLQKYL